MIISAAFETHLNWAAWLLMFGATGTFMYNGLKLPYFLFFGKNNCSDETWEKAADPPWNMQMAMAAGSVLCIVVGSAPALLYSLLPYPVSYHPYNGYHIAETLQILGFAAAGLFHAARNTWCRKTKSAWTWTGSTARPAPLSLDRQASHPVV